MTTKPRVGFIGLGLMGSARVERLQSLGYPLTVIAHRSRTRIDEAVARGAAEAAGDRDGGRIPDIVAVHVDIDFQHDIRFDSFGDGARGILGLNELFHRGRHQHRLGGLGLPLGDLRERRSGKGVQHDCYRY